MKNGRFFSSLSGMAFLAAFVTLTTWGCFALKNNVGNIMLIWVPNAATLAFVLQAERKVWWRFLAIGFIANCFGNFLGGVDVISTVVLSILNSIEIFVAVWLVRPSTPDSFNFEAPQALFKFSLYALLVAPFISSGAAALYLWQHTGRDPFDIFVHWLLAHTLGLAVITPLFLGFFQAAKRRSFSWRKIGEGLPIFLASLALIGAVFYQTSYPFLFFIPPALMLLATKQGLPSVIVTMPFLSFITLYATINGHGPVALAHSTDLTGKIILAQMFILCNLVMLSFVAALATERELAVQEIARLAMQDGLTGIANRRCFDETLARETRRAVRENKKLSLLLLDIDHFKAYNDSYGHPAGDQCIIKLAQNLAHFAHRPGDLTARYGGEEMAVILVGCDQDGARKIAAKIRQSVEDMRLPHQGNRVCGGVVTVSVGVATTEADQDNGKTLLDNADKALYEAKRTGRNKVVCLDSIAQDTMPTSINEEARLATTDAYIKRAPRHSSELDNIAYLAATMLNTPISFVSMVSRDEQIFIGRYGSDAISTSRDVSFCAHTLNGDMPLVVTDATLDQRFATNALVTGDPNIRFYAGAPLMTSAESTHLGALCVIDQTPRPALNPDQLKMLSTLAALAVKCLETDMPSVELPTYSA